MGSAEPHFLVYEAVRRSGMVDMADAEAVAAFARHMCDVELTAAEVGEVAANYTALAVGHTEADIEPYLQMIRSRDLDLDGEMDIEEGW